MRVQKSKIISVGSLLVLAYLFSASVSNAATTIGTNISTGGTLSITGVSTLATTTIGSAVSTAKFAIVGNGASTGKSFTVENSSNTEKFSVTDSGALNIAGNLSMISGSQINFTGNYNDPSTTGWILGDVISPTGAAINTARALTMAVFGASNQGFLIRNEANTSLFEVNGDGTKAFIKGNLGVGTSSPSSVFHVTAGASATTTVEFGDQYSASSKSCYNTKNTAGTAISFYFVGTSMVVENNRCR